VILHTAYSWPSSRITGFYTDFPVRNLAVPLPQHCTRKPESVVSTSWDELLFTDTRLISNTCLSSFVKNPFKNSQSKRSVSRPIFKPSTRRCFTVPANPVGRRHYGVTRNEIYSELPKCIQVVQVLHSIHPYTVLLKLQVHYNTNWNFCNHLHRLRAWTCNRQCIIQNIIYNLEVSPVAPNIKLTKPIDSIQFSSFKFNSILIIRIPGLFHIRTVKLTLEPERLVGMTTGPHAERTSNEYGFNKDFLSAAVSKLALWPTHPSVQLIPNPLSA